MSRVVVEDVGDAAYCIQNKFFIFLDASYFYSLCELDDKFSNGGIEPLELSHRDVLFSGQIRKQLNYFGDCIFQVAVRELFVLIGQDRAIFLVTALLFGCTLLRRFETLSFF